MLFMVKQTVHVLLFAVLVLTLPIAQPQAKSSTNNHRAATAHGPHQQQHIARQWIPMRDGIRLDADIYFPEQGQPPYPTVLMRTPYPTELFDRYYSKHRPYKDFLAQGYVFIYQNERGRYWSEGQGSFLANAKNDGYDTLDWISQQPWSNGKVGTIGCSSSAENQLGLSVANHPAHVAAIAEGAGAGIGRIGPYLEQGNLYRGGVLQLWAPGWFNEYIMYGGNGANQRPQFPNTLTQAERVRLANTFKLWPWGETWGKPRTNIDYPTYYRHLPISDINRAVDGGLSDWETFSRRSPADPAWRHTDFVNEGDTFHTPMLWVNSWYDLAIAPNVALFNAITQQPSATGERAKGTQFMLIGPGHHCAFGYETENTLVGERPVGDARYDYAQHYIDWFDYWLKDKNNEVLKRPRVQHYQMGDNQWISGDQFPAANTTKVAYYLHSNGQANSLFGDGQLHTTPSPKASVDRFTYDPNFPVPSLGGGTCCMGDLSNLVGAYDQRPVETRQDILVYSTAPLPQDLPVAGFIEAELYISSDVPDTDFTLKLIDVDPQGTAYNLDETIFRVRYRDGYANPRPMVPGKIYKISFPPMITANTFKAGHRVRLEISSSNFPRFNRNLNTGGNNAEAVAMRVAHNQVHHSPHYASVIRLPVINRPAGNSMTHNPPKRGAKTP